MNKILACVALLLLVSAPCFAWTTWQRPATVLVGNTTVTINLPNNVGENSYLLVPTLTSATLTLLGSMDGTNFGTIYDEQTNGTVKIAWGVAATTGGFIVEIPPINVFKKIRITCGAMQAASRAFLFFGT